ncbi:MAG: ROK family protein [Gaiella sp.]
MRRANLAAVMRFVAGGGRVSRARIATATGLTRGTVSSLVAELVERGLLRETGVPTAVGRVGRPGLGLELGTNVVAVGLEPNVDYLAAVAEDLRGNVLHERRVYRENRLSSPEPVLDVLADLAEEVIAACAGEGRTVIGVGVAVPGIVERDTQLLRRAPNLGWHDMRVADEIGARLSEDLPVVVENESNLAALAEQRLGAARAVDNFALAFGEVGVGGGIVVDGQLFRGAHGFGGELGHMTVVRDGQPCLCGARGCLERYAGVEAIAARAGVHAEGERTTSLAIELVRRAEAGDAAVLKSLVETGEHLGTALASLVNLLDLDVVVLGGCFAVLFPWLAGPVSSALDQGMVAQQWTSCEVRQSALGESAPVRGAAHLGLVRVLDAPWTVDAGPLVEAV